MVDTGTQMLVDKCHEIAMRLQKLDTRKRVLFAASVSERLLPSARESISSWRLQCWKLYRNTLDVIWEHLESSELVKRNWAESRESLSQCLPDEDDLDWDGSIGSFEAGLAVIHTIDLIIGRDGKGALRVGEQPLEAIDQYLRMRMFPSAQSGDRVDYKAIFSSKMMQDEIIAQENDLDRLFSDYLVDENFGACVAEFKERSIQSYLEFELR